MTRILEIATELPKASRDLQYANVTIDHLRQDLADRKLNLTPEGGWPGKNAEERSIAAEKAFASDPACADMAKRIREIELSQVELVFTVQSLEAERRALEWSIRAQLVDALTGRGIQREEIQASVAESAFDDTAQDALDIIPEELPAVTDKELFFPF